MAANDTPQVQLTRKPLVQSQYETVDVASQPPLPITGLSTRTGTYGSVGTATLETNISTLPFNISRAARRGPLNVVVGLYPGPEPIFTGIVDDIEYTFETDTATLACRDLGSTIQETTLDPKVLTKATLGNAVLALAQGAGLTMAFPEVASDLDALATPHVTTTGVIAGGGGPAALTTAASPPFVGDFFRDGYYFTERRANVWSVLHKLAQAFGMVVYFMPNGHLYFGPRDTWQIFGTPPVTLRFRHSTRDGTLLKLRVKHQCNRHSFFTVRVTGHDRKNGKTTQTAATYINENLSRDLSTQVDASNGLPLFADRPGLYVGLTVEEVQQIVKGLPLYEMGSQGLKAQETLQECVAKAQEIQGQEFVVEGEVLPGDAGILDIGDPVLFDVEGSTLLSGMKFTVTDVSFHFDLNGGGLVETFTAWKSAANIEGVGP
jgi:hypothetical protein